MSAKTPEDVSEALSAAEEVPGSEDEWAGGATWADDIPLACNFDDPDVCESCQ